MDETIKCIDCGADFVYTEKDQAFYADKGFKRPKRCKDCRVTKKARMNSK